MNAPFTSNRLKNAIARGLASGDLTEELAELGEIKLKTESDAEAVCWGLQQLTRETPELPVLAHSFTSLFQNVTEPECEAIQTLLERGIPELIRVYDLLEECDAGERNARLFILKVLALYGTTEGVLKVLDVARQPFAPDNYMWSVIFGVFQPGHPQNELFYRSLRDPLPDGFMAVSLLDAANAVLIAGESLEHPFDTPEGVGRLKSYLTNADESEYSYAHSATAAVPFLSHPDRDTLLELAIDHPEAGVRMEACWAAARLGREAGLQRLIEYCLDFKTAESAKQYLTELGREDAIPPLATEPGFTAMSRFAQWCAHPSELGRMPDEVTIVDERELAWPPAGERKSFWLIKYKVLDRTGLEEDEEECGLVGSVTFCFFTTRLAQRPPEDAYAVHAYWEMECDGLIEETDVQDETEDYSSLLAQWTGTPLRGARMLLVTELSPELHYPQRLVGLASATLAGEPGWVVLDGLRSQWYPASEQPVHAYHSTILKIHVGRHLLGFKGKPDRKKYLAPKQPLRSPEQIICAYEKLLEAALAAAPAKRGEAFGTTGKLADHFDRYIQSLVKTGQKGKVRNVLGRFAPHWDHPWGHEKLGAAAFSAGQDDLADQFWTKFKTECENWERSLEMAGLARIWHRSGRTDQARELLLNSLARLLESSKSATGADIGFFEEKFQHHRSAFLRLFPEEEALLARRGIPASTILSSS